MLLPLLLACAPDAPLVSHPVGTEPYVCSPSEERAGDGIDNDCDGLLDCADPDLQQPFPGPIDASNIDEVCATGCPRAAPGGIDLRGSRESDLQALSCLTEAWSVTLEGNDELTSLRGLEGLEALHELRLVDNGLVDLSGLSGLREVSTSLVVASNPQLVDLGGLEQLHTAPTVEVTHNPALVSVGGLEGLGSVEHMRIEGNDALLDLTGLDGLTEVGALTVAGNPQLVRLTGLEQLTAAQDLLIDGHPSLVAVDALSSLERVDGTLSFWSHSSGPYGETFLENVALGDLEGLSQLHHVGTLMVAGVPSLTGLEGLQTLGGLVTGGEVQDLSALQGVLIDGDLVVTNAADLTGLESLVHAGTVELVGPRSLAPLAGLESVVDLTVRNPGPEATGLPALREATSIYWNNGAPVLELPALTSVGDLTVHGGVQALLLADGVQVEELVLSQADVSSYTAPAGSSLASVELQRCEALEMVDLSGAAHVGALHLVTDPQLSDLQLPPVDEMTSLVVSGTALSTLDPFAGVQRIDGVLSVTNNPDLVDVSALHGLQYVGDVTVTGNGALGNPAAFDLVDAIDEVSGTTAVWGNQ